MIVEKEKAVSINYILTNQNEEMLDSTQNQAPMIYLHGASNLLPGLENALEGKSIKSRVRTIIPAEEGYGKNNPDLVQTVPLSTFPNSDKIEEGCHFQLETSYGPRTATIAKVANGEVTIDMNHPFAGQTLHFDVEIVDIRDATPDEIEKGHIHIEGCSCEHDH
jgi:FKBP-type peptidyl-prolyl cis-trans isomerase SlyD